MGASSAVNLSGMLNQIGSVLGDPSGGLAITDAMQAVNEREAEKAKQQKMMAALQEANQIGQQGVAAVQQGDPGAVQSQLDKLNKMAASASDPKQLAAILEMSNQLQSQLPAAREGANNAAVSAVLAMEKEIKNYETAMADPVQKLYAQMDPTKQQRYEVFKQRKEMLMTRPEVQKGLTAYKAKQEEQALDLAKKKLTVEEMQMEQQENKAAKAVAAFSSQLADNPDMPIPPQLAQYEEDILKSANAISALREERKSNNYVKPISEDVIAAARGSTNPIVDEAIARYEAQSWTSQAEKKQTIDTIYTGAEGFIGEVKDKKERIAENKAKLRLKTIVGLTQTEGIFDTRQDLWEQLRDITEEDPMYDTLIEVIKQNSDDDIKTLGMKVLQELDTADVPVTKEATRLYRQAEADGRMDAAVTALMKENEGMSKEKATREVKRRISQELASRAIKRGNIN